MTVSRSTRRPSNVVIRTRLSTEPEKSSEDDGATSSKRRSSRRRPMSLTRYCESVSRSAGTPCNEKSVSAGPDLFTATVAPSACTTSTSRRRSRSIRATMRSTQPIIVGPPGTDPSTSHAIGLSATRMNSSVRLASDFEGRRSPSTQSASAVPDAFSSTNPTDFASSPDGSSSQSFG